MPNRPAPLAASALVVCCCVFGSLGCEKVAPSVSKAQGAPASARDSNRFDFDICVQREEAYFQNTVDCERALQAAQRLAPRGLDSAPSFFRSVEEARKYGKQRDEVLLPRLATLPWDRFTTNRARLIEEGRWHLGRAAGLEQRQSAWPFTPVLSMPWIGFHNQALRHRGRAQAIDRLVR